MSVAGPYDSCDCEPAREGRMTAEQRILAWLEKADFDGTGCRHSQDTIARAVGCSREHVNRCTKNLAADGRISIEKERRPGLKWPCNVYRVQAWNPNKRSGVLGVLKAIRESRQAQCHTEGTAKLSRAHIAPKTPLPHCETSLADAARRHARETHERTPRVCEHCWQVEHKLAKASDELVGAYETIKAQGKELTRVKRELSTETSPLAQDVRRVLDAWGETHPAANTDATGYRAKVVRGAMKLGHTDPPMPCEVHDPSGNRIKGVAKDVCCTVADELIEALEGLRLMPFVGPHGRCAVAGPGTRRYDGIEYALTDRKSGAPSEATIERFRGYARWAKMSSSERLYAAFQRTGEVHDEYASRLLRALAKEQAEKQLVAESGWGNVVDISSVRKDAA